MFQIPGVSINKRKAKIEELENEKEKYFEKQVIQHEIEILHSLLEKEQIYESINRKCRL